MLVRRYEDMEPWYVYELCAVPGPPVGSSKWRREREARAERTLRDVKKELVELMDMDEVSKRVCFLSHSLSLCVCFCLCAFRAWEGGTFFRWK